MTNSKARYVDHIINSLKQLYACTAESTNFINPQALSSTLVAVRRYSLGPSGL